MSRERMWEAWREQLPSLLTLAWLAPFFLVPLAFLGVYAFATQNYLTGVISFGWTLAPWRRVADPIVFDAFSRSVAAAGITTLVTAVIGYPIAYFVARHAGRLQNLALVLVILPFWVSFIVRAYAWVDLLAEHGLINRLLLRSGLISSPIPLVHNMTGVAIGLVYGYLPLMVFPLYASLRAIDPHLLEAARDLGASWWTAFWRVTFPQASPGLVAGATIVFIPALGEFVIPSILGGGKSFLFGNLIAIKFSRFTWPEGAALAIAILILALAIIGIGAGILGRKRFGEAVVR